MNAILIRASHRKCGHHGGLSRHFEFWRHQVARLVTGGVCVGQVFGQRAPALVGPLQPGRIDHKIGISVRAVILPACEAAPAAEIGC